MSNVEFVPLAFIAEVLHPPLELPERILKELYLDISEGHRYSTLQLLEGRGGAVFASGEQRRQCKLLPDRIIVSDEHTEQNFHSFTEEFLDIVQQVQLKARLPVLLTAHMTLRTLLPLQVSEAETGKFILENWWKPGWEVFEGFQRPLGGMGLRFVFPPAQEKPSEVQLRLEPYFVDRRMFFVELQYRFFQPIQRREELEQICKESDRFLHEEIAKFMGQLLGE